MELLEHVDTVNNIEIAKKIIMDNWKSPDDYWFVSIVQRYKDNYNVLDNTNKPIFVKQKNYSSSDYEMGKKNFIGYCIIMGNTVDEAVNSLLNPTIYVFNLWAKNFNMQNTIPCNDNKFGNIIKICNSFNARAYMNINPKSYHKNTNRELIVNQMTPIKVKQVVGKEDPYSKEVKFHYISTSGSYSDKNSPFYLIDCDIDDEKIVNKIKQLLKNYGINISYQYASHNGYHIIFDVRSVSNDPKMIRKTVSEIKTKLEGFGRMIDKNGKELDFSNTQKKTQEWMVELEHDKNILLYSPVGNVNNNSANPSWNKNKVYPYVGLREGSYNRRIFFNEEQIRQIIKESIYKNIYG